LREDVTVSGGEETAAELTALSGVVVEVAAEATVEAGLVEAKRILAPFPPELACIRRIDGLFLKMSGLDLIGLFCRVEEENWNQSVSISSSFQILSWDRLVGNTCRAKKGSIRRRPILTA
jgi:hypothetical protein